MITVDRYRALALGMEGAIESAHMGHPDFRAHGRIFATVQTDERGAIMLTPDQQKIFLRDYPDMFVPESGAWGLQGSTRVLFQHADEDVVGEALTLAWQYSAVRGAAKKAGKAKGAGKAGKAGGAGKAGKAGRAGEKSAAKKPARPTKARRK